MPQDPSGSAPPDARPPRVTANMLQVMALLYAGEAHYGLSLARALKIGNGTLYPLLERLEDAGWICGTFEETGAAHLEGRRPRRFYALTPEGTRAFERERAALSVTRPLWGMHV